MKISFAISAALFSLILLLRALVGFGPSLFVTITAVIAFSVPIFILEFYIKKISATSEKYFTEILKRVIQVSFLSVLLYFIVSWIAYQPYGFPGFFGPLGFILSTPFLWVGFALLNYIAALCLLLCYWSPRFSKIFIVGAFMFSSVSVIYGGWLFSDCDWQGCRTSGYFVTRAIQENDPSICVLADKSLKLPISIYGLLDFVTPVRVASQNYLTSNSSCYAAFAVRTHTPKVCDLVDRGISRDNCLAEAK